MSQQPTHLGPDVFHSKTRNAYALHNNYLVRVPCRHGMSFAATHVFVHDEIRLITGPRAPTRKRPKRVAKKIAARGGMRRARGVVQTLYKSWPAMRWWKQARAS